MLIELPGALVQRMNKQRPDPSVLCDGLHTSYCVLEQGSAKLDALSARIDREPRQYHDRHRIGHVASDRASGFLVCDGPDRQRVIP